ncbi:pyridoxamine 5'-phosphate oxidase family protein [Candidatus Nitrospira neomarina]|uniref:Pyridoxamine 5'-phosphate oxidase family protein n=1 Tax=Candidatus Nitrospira neomarina TaxID=3020899 RepID=A0AA96JVH8_9BACT|nr:pyridoxamine 5'-phosphate oxidase family protein [Candidatus Nitrospira neomarina]WNM61065.1 pyridoxamine 5'-phosphate oxidase family protein [Candidatus Nitrospira neomarina]
MKPPISDIAFTPSVKVVQERLGSRQHYARMEEREGWSDTITPELADFLRERDSFYFATASAAGRPYIQHRGGPKGFLRVLDDRTLAFADFKGNRQYISLGNLAENHQAFLFLMDYATQTRIKMWGTAEVIEGAQDLLKQLTDTHYKGKPERVIRFHVEAWDANCRQHIPAKYSQEEVERLMLPLRNRITALETEIEILNRQLRVSV